jgi:hypothetical protein
VALTKGVVVLTIPSINCICRVFVTHVRSCVSLFACRLEFLFHVCLGAA